MHSNTAPPSAPTTNIEGSSELNEIVLTETPLDSFDLELFGMSSPMSKNLKQQQSLSISQVRNLFKLNENSCSLSYIHHQCIFLNKLNSI